MEDNIEEEKEEEVLETEAIVEAENTDSGTIHELPIFNRYYNLKEYYLK